MTKIRTIRAAAAARVKLTGVTVVAADVGITPLELNAFLIGVIPHGDVHTRLKQWFQREADQADIAAAAAGREIVATPQVSITCKREGILTAKEFRELLRSFNSAPPPAGIGPGGESSRCERRKRSPQCTLSARVGREGHTTLGPHAGAPEAPGVPEEGIAPV